MAGIGSLQALGTWSAHTFANHALHLEPMQPPQPTHAFLVDSLLAIEQHADAAIAIARVLGSQFLNLAEHGAVIGCVRRVVKCRPMELHYGAGTAHRQSTRDEEPDGGASVCQR